MSNEAERPDHEEMTGTERVGCYLLRYDDGTVRTFSSFYPVLAEDWEHATVTIASWTVLTEVNREEEDHDV